MAKKNEISFFHKTLQKFEKTLLDYYLEKADFSVQSESLSKIFAFISIYGTLTQTQLKKLTGFSKSTISTGLANLINIGYVKKQKIPHSREYEYFISYSSDETIDDALGSMNREINFFKKIIRKLESLNIEKDYHFTRLLERLSETLQVFNFYQTILESIDETESKIENKLNQNIFETFETTISSRDIKHINIKINPELRQIEEEIIDFFKYDSVYSFLEEFSLTVFVYFITRKVLTQEKVRELTKLSLGKVSEVINELLKQGYIIKVDKNRYDKSILEDLERKTLYAMASIKDFFIISGINSFDQMLKWERKFKRMQKELIENRKTIKKKEGYHKILKAVQSYLDVIPSYRKVKHIFLKFVEM
jgi:DNA-binding transcriptional regulator GbsR (MarR family)